MQTDGLYRKFKFVASEKMFREVEAKYLIRELTSGGSVGDNAVFDFTHVKIYPEFGKMVAVYEDLDSNYTNTVNDSFSDVDYSHEVALFELRVFWESSYFFNYFVFFYFFDYLKSWKA